MKARITTVLSITGVMVAGSAAALVNSQVLRNSNTTANYEVSSNSVQASIISASPDDPQAVSVGKFDTAVAVAVTTVAVPGSTQSNYFVGTAGYVTLDTKDDVLAMPLAVPTDGWTVLWAGSNDAYSADAVFESVTTRLTFKATMIFGVVNYSVEVEDLTPQTTAETPKTTAGTTTSTSKGTNPGVTTTTVKHEDDHHHGGWWPTPSWPPPTTSTSTTSTTSTSTTSTIRRDD